jgi:threonyl-tRNA synthetase
MEYVDSNNTLVNPYIIHRTSMGCYERTLALLIEKYAGALPLWMSPTQVKVITITDRVNEYAAKVNEMLKAAGIRSELDARAESANYKIRGAQLEKIPYMLVIGDKEVEEGTVSVRTRDGKNLGALSIEEFITKAVMENATKAR